MMRKISARYEAYRDFRRARWEDERERKRKERRARDQAPVPVLRGEERKAVLSQVVDIMRDWRSSPFEFQGVTRAGLRAGLCQNGYDWLRSDREAEKLVLEALANLGAKWPTWEQGQPEYTDPSDVCSWCKRAFSDEQMQGARRPKFCSTHCARAAIQRRDWENCYIDTKIGRTAYLLIRKEEGTRRACKECGEEFGVPPSNPGQIFCSTACSNGSKKLSDKQCRHCGETFHPKSPQQLFCSRACSDRSGRPPQFHKQCVYCAGWFMARLELSRFCSQHCRSMDYHYGVKRVRPNKLIPAAFDYFVCVPPIESSAYTASKGRIPQALNPHNFDWWALEQGLRITQTVAI